jgi:peptidyl-tRNA hydrolase, PTH1 family
VLSEPIEMLLLVGLGNPGSSYGENRHNIGFMVVEAIASRHSFGPWRKRFQAEVSEGVLSQRKTLLVKPQTFMNESGRAVSEALRFYKLPLESLVVLHDELDLSPGKLRAKVGGGAAGHNGLRSLDAHLGPGYRRIRLGIGHPGDKARVTGHVLGDFSKADAGWLEPFLAAIAEEAPWLAKNEDQRFASAVAQRLTPPRPKPEPAPSSDQGEP